MKLKPMKIQKMLKAVSLRAQSLMVVGAILLALAPASRAAIVGPYTVDANTLHLWHFDETGATPFLAPTNALEFDSVSNNPQTSAITFSNTPGKVNEVYYPGYPPTSFALQGVPSFTVPGTVNYGTCVQTTNFSCLIMSEWYDGSPGVGANTLWPPTAHTNMINYVNATTGAFTWEALIYPLVNPRTAGLNMEIIAGDDGFPYRAWQFRINASGQLEFNMNINIPSGTHDFTVALPSTGPDAANAGNWYHVAATYTGDSPTNGDTPKQFKLYWTLMDPTRTNADVLFTGTPSYGFTNAAQVILGIGGSGRGDPINNVCNNEGFVGNIDEVRMSSVCRKSTEMAFNTNLYFAPPIISITPTLTNQLIGYGQTLTVTPSETGSLPITNQWYQNSVALPGQTNATLVISNVTFAANGNYQLAATNAFGSTNSVVCTVNVGAAFSGLFNTGVDANGNPTPPNGAVDLHWTLIQSANPGYPGPNAIDLGPQARPTGAATPGDLVSEWIATSTAGNNNTGPYSYQTVFQLDNGDSASATLSGTILANGPHGGDTVQAFLNGVETDLPLASNPISTAAPFVITNGMQAGTNVLVFTMNGNGGNIPEGCFRIEVAGIGNALPPGLPVITNEPPASQTVPYGSTALIPEVTLGRPPLAYQWYSNGIAISGATSQNLSFAATNFSPSEVVGGQFSANYQVAVSNASGSVTSSVSALTIQIPPLTVVSAGEPLWNPANNETNIVVLFSDTLNALTATSAGNYSLSPSGSVLSAALAAPNEVVLTTSLLNPATAYTLTVQNVEDSFDQTVTTSPTNLLVGIYPAATALWVKANTGVTTDANGVNQWNDLSGNVNNLVQSGGSPFEPQLVPNVINGQPVIRFAATNETFMQAADSPTLEITNDLTVFAVINFATLAGGTNGMIVSKTGNNNIADPYDYYANSSSVLLLRGNGATSQSVNSSTLPSVGSPHLLDVTMQGTSVSHRLDGNTNGTGTLSTAIADSGSPLYIGTRYDQVNRLTGDLAELIVIGSALSAYDVSSVENYLAAEYHLPIGANSGPAITQQPVASTNISQGATLTVAAAASGNPAVAYQWYDTNNIPAAGQTNATLVISNIQASDSYYLQASNTFGSATSTVVAVTVISGLNVSLGPPNVTVYAGQAYTYSAVAFGTVPLHYQWFQGASAILNATNASYPAVASLGSTTYSVTVSNAYNGYSSTNAGPVTLIGVATSTNLYEATVLGNHPVAYWELNEVPDNGAGNNGTIAYDYVGGHNGAYTNVVLGFPNFSSISSTDTAVQVGSFSTNNSYVGEINQSSSGVANVNFATPSGGNAELSVEAWVMVTNTSEIAGAGIVTKGYGNGGEQFDLDYNGDFRFFVRDASGSVHVAASAVAVAVKNWYHLVGVWDGAGGTAYLYINGVTNVVTTGAPAGVGLLTATTTNTALPGAALVSIGARASSQSVTNYDLQFKGRIENVAIYNYALTPTQVFADFGTGVKNTVVVPSLATLTGTNYLTLAWPAPRIGWRLLAQTNSPSKGLGTNWVAVANANTTNTVVIPINRTNASVFYELVYP